MSDLVSNTFEFDTSLDTAERPEPLPALNYPAECTSALLKHSKSGKPMLELTYRIANDALPMDWEDAAQYPEGIELRNWFVLENTPRGRFRAKLFREAHGLDTKTNSVSAEDFLGAEVVVTIGHQDAFDGSGGQDARIVSVNAK